MVHAGVEALALSTSIHAFVLGLLVEVVAVGHTVVLEQQAVDLGVVLKMK